MHELSLTLEHFMSDSISITILDALSNDLVSHMISFSMVRSPGIVCRKAILAKMFTHDLLCLSMPICTTAAGTPIGTRSFSLSKGSIQESIGLLNPFITLVTPTGPAVYIHSRSSIL